MRRRLLTAFALLVAIIAVGTSGYRVFEGWGLLDSLYMTVTTISTVGFGEVKPLSDTGRIFTMALILVGVGALGFALATVVDFFVEGHLRGLLEERRMESQIARLSGHHIVAGIGRVGTEVANAFAAAGEPFVVIDDCDDCIERATAHGWLHIFGDATDEGVLRTAGIERAASLVTTIDTDAANVFVTLSARGINPKLLIVGRASTSSAEEKMLRAGADRVITPSVIGGRRMASMVLNPEVSDYLDLMATGSRTAIRLEEVELREESKLAGRTIGEAHIRDLTGALILAIHEPDGSVTANPSSDTMLSAGDRLIVIGTVDQLDRLGDRL